MAKKAHKISKDYQLYVGMYLQEQTSQRKIEEIELMGKQEGKLTMGSRSLGLLPRPIRLALAIAGPSASTITR